MVSVRRFHVLGVPLTGFLLTLAIAFGCLALLGTSAFAQPLGVSAAKAKQMAKVGELIFNDTNLSEPPGRQACAPCHRPGTGFTDAPNAVSTGGFAGTSLGGRNAPTNAYVAGFCPPFDASKGEAVGGFFWDGRGRTNVEQATMPFFNPVELANDPNNIPAFIDKIRAAQYRGLFKKAFGKTILDPGNEAAALAAVGKAIVSMEMASTFNAFTSKFDAVQLGLAAFTPQEDLGFAVFQEYCSNCHSTNPTNKDGTGAVFSTFIYRNVGVPANPDNTVFPPGTPDPGLAGNPLLIDGLDPVVDLALITLLKNQAAGRFKVPTLRNIAVSGPYMHNGVFTTLAQVVHFYNTRDAQITAGTLVPETLSTMTKEVVSSAQDTLGALNLPFVGDGNGTLPAGDEEAALVAFLNTLTDGFPGVKFPE